MSPFRVNKYFEEPPVTKIKISNMKWTFQCFKFIMKKYRIFLFLLAKDQNRDIKLGSIKLWEFMLKDYQNISLIPMNLSNRKCSKAVKIDLSLRHKWMQALVEPILLFLFNLNKNKLLKEKKDKNYQSFT